MTYSAEVAGSSSMEESSKTMPPRIEGYNAQSDVVVHPTKVARFHVRTEDDGLHIVHLLLEPLKARISFLPAWMGLFGSFSLARLAFLGETRRTTEPRELNKP